MPVFAVGIPGEGLRMLSRVVILTLIDNNDKRYEVDDMSNETIRTGTVSKGDRAGIWIFVVVGAALAVWAVIAAVLRIVEVSSGRDVPVFAEFAWTAVDAPIGRDGSAVPVEMMSGWVTVPALSTVGVTVLVLQQVLAALLSVILIGCLVRLSWGVLRDRIFSRRNTVLTSVAGFAALAYLFGVPFLGTMAAGEAFAQLDADRVGYPVNGTDFAAFLFTGFVAALATTVFAVGDRLQRDTKGLV